jgi:hypothetical protein
VVGEDRMRRLPARLERTVRLVAHPTVPLRRPFSSEANGAGRGPSRETRLKATSKAVKATNASQAALAVAEDSVAAGAGSILHG